MHFMWGNRLGWILAVMVLAIEITFVWLIARQDQVSAPTDFARNPDYIGVMDFPLPPTTVVPSMTRTDDTGATCREAMSEVIANLDAYADFLDRGKDSDAPKLRAIYLLRDAATSTNANLFAATPEAVISYEPDKPRLDALVLAGRCAIRAGLLAQKSNPAEAKLHLEAAFSLGWKLYQERLTDTEMRAGFELLGQAALSLEKLAGASSQTKQFNDTRMQFYKTRIEPVRRVILSVDPNVIAANVGNYFYFARNAKDRVWRIEAVLALGRLQYYVGENGRAANQTGARKELTALLDDPDPLIRCAAKAAKDLTIEQYRSIR
jgi:hypothetical protein